MAELKNLKEENFVRGILNGLSNKEAYRAAFPESETKKDKTISNYATKLIKKEEVKERLAELSQKNDLTSTDRTNSKILSWTERKEWLSQVIKDEMQEMRDRLKAVDSLNKMDGEKENYNDVENDNGFLEALNSKSAEAWDDDEKEKQ